MTIVSELLAAKKQKSPICIKTSATVLEALTLMSTKEVSALAVVNEPGTLDGFFTERDCVRRVALGEKDVRQTRISDVMTPAERVYFVAPNNTLDECMVLMTTKQIRHLPVLENGRFLGLLSIGDVLRSLIAEKESIIEQLSPDRRPK